MLPIRLFVLYLPQIFQKMLTSQHACKSTNLLDYVSGPLRIRSSLSAAILLVS